jgi:hypothetical protein
MSQKDLLQNQVIEEILREKASYYNARRKNPDFWLLISPSFLKEVTLLQKVKDTKFYFQQRGKIKCSFFNQNNHSEFYAALVSTDEEFMRWIKLRLGYFENINEITKNNHNVSYVSDGIAGIINKENNSNVLESNPTYLHPEILVNKYKNSLEQYFITIK